MSNRTYQYSTIEEHRSHQKSLAIEGHDIAYIDKGNGPVILLVHGVPTSSWLYRYIISALIKEGFRVIAPDLLGYGSSAKPDGVAIYDPPQQGKRLLQLMDYLAINKWTHILHDAGGIWSWEMMLLTPERIEKLVVLNTIIYSEGFKPPMRFKRGSFLGKMYANLYKSKLFCKIMINSTLQNGTCKHKFSSSDKKGYWLPMSEGSSKALYSFFTSFDYIEKHLTTYQNHLKVLDIPVLTIWGKRDKILQGEKQIPLLSADMNIKSGHQHLLEDATHFIQEEKSHFISDLISSFAKSS